jgi:acetylornithine/succinyldiaminopimelate/putrescine aminotransferase
MNERELLSAFHAHVAPTSLTPMGMSVSSARGSTIRDSHGNEHMDLLAGIGVAALGHGNRAVLAAVEEQLHRYLHVMVYGEFVLEKQVALAQRLTSLLPDPLDSVYFTNSGTEAVEGALKLTRRATRRSRVLSFDGAFHGDTLGSVSVGGNPVYREPFQPLLPEVGFLGFNDHDCLDAIDDSVAAVIVEPVQAEAGVILPQPGFLGELRRRCTEAGALLIFDEVITGFGRTGSLFALERIDGEAVVPDVLVLAKALGGGLPLGAFIASKKLLKTFAVDPPLGHVTTFGGHPLSCAAGLASLAEIERMELPARAERVGALFEEKLAQRLPEPFRVEIRRAGLLVGIEMESPERVERFTAECRAEGLILGWTLHDDKVVRIAPPLIITEAEIDEAAFRMQRAALRVLGD